MGTKWASTYANLCLGYLEQKLYMSIKESFSKTIADKLKCGYKRFLDGIIIFIKIGLVEENVLSKILNSLDSKLTFKGGHKNHSQE